MMKISRERNNIRSQFSILNSQLSEARSGFAFDYNYDRGNIISERNSSDKVTRTIRGLGLVAQKDAKNQLFFYIQNRHGDVTGIFDGSGNLLNQYTYDAFGQAKTSTEQIANRFKYSGEQLDSITGHYYLRARFYNPVIGRFTQEDSYRGDGLNLYSYVRNNPVNFVDPSGNFGIPKWVKDRANDVKKGVKKGLEVVQKGMDKVNEVLDSTHIDEYIYTAVEIVGGAATVAATVAGTVLSGGSLTAPMAVAGAHGLNSLANGIRDAGHIIKGEVDKVGSENYLKDAYEDVGQGIGYVSGEIADVGNDFFLNKETNYSKSFSDIGGNVGEGAYYINDIYFSGQGVKDAVKGVTAGNKVKNLKFIDGNWIDGYKLKEAEVIIEKAPGVAKKIKMGTEGVMNGINGAFNGVGLDNDVLREKKQSQCEK